MGTQNSKECLRTIVRTEDMFTDFATTHYFTSCYNIQHFILSFLSLHVIHPHSLYFLYVTVMIHHGLLELTGSPSE